MENLTTFTNEEFGQIRTVDIEDKLYFVASDIAKSLGYKRPNDAVTQHCRYTVKYRIPHPQSNTKTIEVNVIPEGDVYRLIVNSKLPTAEKFESWVFDEVLPQIRKTGGYIPVTEEDEEKTIMAKALQIMDRTIKMLDRTIDRQDIRIHELEGDVYKLEGLAIQGYSLKDLSTCLGYKERFLDDYCISQGWYSRVNHDVIIKDNRYVKRLKKNSINFTDLGRETLIEKFRDNSKKLF